MKTNENFIAAVAKLCRMEEEELKKQLSSRGVPGSNEDEMKVIINDFILPYGVEPGGQDVRGWRISPQFMVFMAEWGRYIVERHADGEILYEIAMQRISKGALLHEGVNLWKILPKQYQKYSAFYDQPGLMGKEEWFFLQEQLRNCLVLGEDRYRGHAIKILIGMLEHFNPVSDETDVLWNSELAGITPKEVAQFADELAESFCHYDVILEALAKNWRRHKNFFREALIKGTLTESTILFEIPLEPEVYYTGFHRWLLKTFGLYEKKTMAKVLAEIKA